MIGRIVRPADFQRVLAEPQRARSAHFAVHHVVGAPSRAREELVIQSKVALFESLSSDLSTDPGFAPEPAVDDLHGHWLGLVVPKRLAKRAVTRNLIKRQIREAMAAHAPQLPSGLWVVRLRATFDRQQFISPASDALRLCAHSEIAALMHRAAHSPLPAQPSRPPGSSRPRRSGTGKSRADKPAPSAP